MSELEQIPQSEIDRLIDGEAGAAEQQSLLRRLDETEDGWRRLALCFVEAQTWGSELRLIAEPAVVSEPLRPEVARPSASRAPGWVTVGLTAAVMLVAGLLAGMELRVEPTPPGNSIADSRPGEADEARSPNGRDGFPIAPEELGPGNSEPGTQFVEFVLNDEPGSARTVSVPIHSDGDLEQLLNSSESVLSPGIHEFLDNRGHQLVEERGLIPVELPDGRIAVIPVRQVQLRHMMNRFGQ
ncbi:MAG: hypothetical protein H8E37_06155 [Planctomycetes bacterium]|nr:hypothetical protein [Planctomycetota bacterium]